MWAEPAADVLARLETDAEQGLLSTTALARGTQYGPNALAVARARSGWDILLAQFKSVLVALLALAALVSLLAGQAVEAAAVIAVLVLNGALGFVIEWRAVRRVEALRALGQPRTRVRRDGHDQLVDTAALVPGDVMLVEAGDVIGADARVLHSSKLELDESSLTGESLPVTKTPQTAPQDAPLAERSDMLFKGSAVTRGHAAAVVVHTGMDTELGHISRLVDETAAGETPLEQRLNKLGQGFVWITVALSVLVLASGLLTGTDIWLLVRTVIALAVATVPEGLPVIATIALARGVYRMARQNAVVRRLSAVETLGATSVLFTDKTGTLTQNRMAVRGVFVDPDADTPAPLDAPPARRVLRLAALCNSAELAATGEAVGDPMEVALLRAARDAGLDLDELAETWPQQFEVAFDSETMMMATAHQSPEGDLVAIKGAPERVLDVCDLDDDRRAAWRACASRMAEGGQRVLAVAERQGPARPDNVYAGATLAGLVGLLDPPRPEAQEVMAGCRAAGMRVVMLTGDHQVTAAAIAQEVGLLTAAEHDEDQHRPRFERRVVSRVSPEEKLRIIEAHQRQGAIVAMTGDGVNDAPALKHADIGVAMGGRGTEVAREAADLVLKDDRLATVLVAVREGRIIFDNLRNFVFYLLSCNIAEVLIVGLAAVVGAAVPLLPLQILFLNLVTDVFPALALGVGEGRDDVMNRRPRPRAEQILGPPQLRAVAIHGAVITASVLAAYYATLGPLQRSVAEGQTVTFVALALAQLWHVGNVRAPSSPWLRNEVTTNPYVWAALLVSAGSVLLAVLVPPAAAVLGLAPLDPTLWALALGTSGAPLLVGQSLMALGVVDHTQGLPPLAPSR